MIGTNAHNLSFIKNDVRLDKLRVLAADKNITVIAGAAIKINSELYIGSFIIRPDSTNSIYTKQYLHQGEEKYFSFSSDYNPQFSLGDEKISFAICADINNPAHPQNAAETNCSTYVASIFFTPNGITDGHKLLGGYAKNHSMNVLMSNFCGRSWGMEAGGRSAFWDNNGKRIIEMDATHSGIILVEKNANSWIGQTIIDK